jgi:trans-aconitate methyltransferase
MPHEFDGKKYERASAGLQQEWGAKLIAELKLGGGERVLDLGCGDGSLTLRIAGLLPHGSVLGIDASSGMIEAARTRRRNNLEFRLADINGIDFDDEFDAVFSNATLHWIKDHRGLLARVRRALHSGGRLRFNFGGDGNCATFIRVIREAMALPEFASAFADFEWPWYMPSATDYTALAGSSRLSEVRIWSENADRLFPDAEAMIRWIDQPSLVPFLPRLPAARRENFRALVIDRMIEQARQADGSCFESFRRINLAARK